MPQSAGTFQHDSTTQIPHNSSNWMRVSGDARAVKSFRLCSADGRGTLQADETTLCLQESRDVWTDR